MKGSEAWNLIPLAWGVPQSDTTSKNMNLGLCGRQRYLGSKLYSQIILDMYTQEWWCPFPVFGMWMPAQFQLQAAKLRQSLKAF